VRFEFAELSDEPFQGTNLLGPEDQLGPDGEIAACELREPASSGRLEGGIEAGSRFLAAMMRHYARSPKMRK